MIRDTLRRPAVAFVCGGLLVAAVLAGRASYAAIRDPQATVAATNTITACVKKSNGAMFLRSRCKRGERKISWNIKGPAGPQGARALPARKATPARRARPAHRAQPGRKA